MMPDKLTQPEYLHLLLNHLPIVGLAVATGMTAVALALRNRAAMAVGLVFVALLSAAAWPVMATGEGAYNRVRPLLDDAGRQALRHHMELAEAWSKLYFVTTAAAVLALVVARWKPGWLAVVTAAALLLALAGLAAGAIIAEAGGQIRHPQFRPEAAALATETETPQLQ